MHGNIKLFELSYVFFRSKVYSNVAKVWQQQNFKQKSNKFRIYFNFIFESKLKLLRSIY